MLGAEFTGQFFQDRFLIADVVMKADFPDRALVLVRPALPSRPERAAAPAGRQRLAHRLPARLGRRPGRREEARERDPAHPGDARQGRRVRAGMGLASTSSPAGASTASATAACCSPATRRTRSRPSARAAPTPACRTRTTWSGSSSSCSTATRPRALLDTYHEERAFAADDNLLNSTRATDFITPKSRASRVLRDASLPLAQEHAVRARRWSTAGACRRRRRTCTPR